MQPLRIKSGLNVEKDIVLQNISQAIFYPWVDRILGEGACTLVGGGPSLKDNLDKITGKVIALNGAHDYLIEHGITPDFAFCLDARAENADFYRNPCKGTTYLIASQCHPEVFKALEGHDVRVWHAHSGDGATGLIREYAQQSKKFCMEISGGPTVGLRGMYLAYTIGFTDLHLVGYDSSHDEYHHAYKQPLNDGCDVIEVETGGRTFITSPTMAKQAYQFQSVVKNLVRNGIDITVHGDGLLPEIHRQMYLPVDPCDTEAVERRKYSNMWSFDEYRRFAPGEHHVEQAIEEMGIDGPIIDFGCGTGRGAQKFKDLGFQITGIDHAQNCLDEDVDIDFALGCLWGLPEMDAPYGYCTDVMEHIPTDKIEPTLKGISRCVEKCFFMIHTDHDAMGELIGETLHLTVEDKDWWERKLNEYFAVVRHIEDDRAAIFVCQRG